MGEWKKVRIGEFLTESKEEAINSDSSRRITVRLNCRGVEHRKLKAEKDGATKYYIRHAGQFIYGKQNIHKGAFGIIPKELEGFTSSADLPAFDFINDLCFPEFLNLWLQVDERYKALQKNVKGAGSQRLAVSAFLDEGISLPDLPTQKQIVKRISENLKWVNELAKEIETQKGYTKLLRRNILQDAIEGKLTADWRKEHPVQKGNPDYDAEALFELIQKERKVDKKRKALPPILDAEKPFELPAGWKWVRLGEICEIIGGYAFNSYDFKEVGDNYILRLGNIRNGKIRYDAKPAFVSDKIIAELSEYEAKLNDILITMTGTRGKQDYLYSVKITENYLKRYPMFVNQRVGMIRSKSNADFIYICLKSDMLKASIFESSTGSANQANIGIKALFSWNIPFPPLLEQKEIAQLIERMLLKVDQLEQQILRREEYINQLMKGILKDALEEK